ncbi:MAG: hypothetical protein PHT80_12245 [Lentisphaeria bacterium]|nr:hypothetical protein [Lentisphaeria bacterium]
MRTKIAYVGIALAATLFVSATGALGASTAKWKASGSDGVSLTIELKAPAFKVFDRIDATLTIHNDSEEPIAFACDPLFMMVTYEFHDVQRNRKLEKTYWGEQRHRAADMGGMRGRQLQAGEKLVFRENWNIQYDFTNVAKVRGKALFKYVLPSRDSQNRFAEVEVDGIEFQFEGVDIPLFELITAPPDRSRQPQ